MFLVPCCNLSSSAQMVCMTPMIKNAKCQRFGQTIFHFSFCLFKQTSVIFIKNETSKFFCPPETSANCATIHAHAKFDSCHQQIAVGMQRFEGWPQNLFACRSWIAVASWWHCTVILITSHIGIGEAHAMHSLLSWLWHVQEIWSDHFSITSLRLAKAFECHFDQRSSVGGPSLFLHAHLLLNAHTISSAKCLNFCCGIGPSMQRIGSALWGGVFFPHHGLILKPTRLASMAHHVLSLNIDAAQTTLSDNSPTIMTHSHHESKHHQCEFVMALSSDESMCSFLCPALSQSDICFFVQKSN